MDESVFQDMRKLTETDSPALHVLGVRDLRGRPPVDGREERELSKTWQRDHVCGPTAVVVACQGALKALASAVTSTIISRVFSELERVLNGERCVVLQFDSTVDVGKLKWARWVLSLMGRCFITPVSVSRIAKRHGWNVCGLYRQYPGGPMPKYIVPCDTSGIPGPTRLHLWRSVVGLSGKGPWRQNLMRLLSLLAGNRLLQRLAPALVVVITRRPGQSEHTLINEISMAALGNVRPWSVMLVRPMGLIIVPLYDTQLCRWDYLRIPLSHQARRRIARHREMCNHIRSLNLPFDVPVQGPCGSHKGLHFQVERGNYGIDGQRLPCPVDTMVRSACDALVAIYKVTHASRRPDLARAWVRRLIFVKHAGVVLRDISDDEITSIVHTALGGIRHICLAHNDFHLANLLFMDSGKVESIIDWDMSHKAGLPGTDLLHLLIAIEITAKRTDYRSCIEGILCGRDEYVVALVRTYLRATGLGATVKQLLLAYLLVDVWRKASFLRMEDIRPNTAQHRSLLCDINIALGILRSPKVVCD